MDKVKEFWNKRAELGESSGTNDIMAKELELRILLENIHNASVLDIGCGNGRTLIELCKRNGCNGVGIDYSENMIKSANANKDMENMGNKVKFFTGELPYIDKIIGKFDYVITERCLINIHKDLQYIAFLNIMQHVKDNGSYFMLENFLSGLNNINKLRTKFELSEIEQPWHNHYLDDAIVDTWQDENKWIYKISNFSSTYYLISRIINAKMAENEEKEPQYDADINKIAFDLPALGDFGITKLIIWNKSDEPLNLVAGIGIDGF